MGEVTISDSTLDDLVAVQRNRTDLARCLRGAVTAMEVLLKTGDQSYLPGLPDLIERSKAALKEYDK